MVTQVASVFQSCLPLDDMLRREGGRPLGYLPMSQDCPSPLSHQRVLWREKPAGRGWSGDRKELSTLPVAGELWRWGDVPGFGG